MNGSAAVPPAAKIIQDRQQTEPTAVSGASQPPVARPGDPKEKQTYVAQARDPLAYSIADNLFWNDILMEHALFFTQLMPGPEPLRITTSAGCAEVDPDDPRRESLIRTVDVALFMAKRAGRDRVVAA